MVENNIKNTISELINEIKTTTENNLSNLEQIMEVLIDKVNNIENILNQIRSKIKPTIY
ncbi:hypothetical protein [Spiroplasma citri]|uniref:Uncharacterized protein n=1 Tax=Spiroplasma citri TaxID=2133 RepID=Q14Q82_SPICI|nr:hypothetical protein [Spiroplasma citri]APE74044.1 hypothetical protein SCITRI_00130 [Spiroplasma citri]QIA66320.1 hypothetical protein GMI18_00610 [Spiroplasma citri]QIA68197.1 hypothetical protein GL298_00735 [Spiroplasma citri]QIA70074.1 hypothetical protein GL981_00740 [Spiroplasma citri]QIA72280.1 hypothetical protein GL982_00610 [Spiroplasma citri]